MSNEDQAKKGMVRHSEIRTNYNIVIITAPYNQSTYNMYVPGESRFTLRGLRPRSGLVRLHCAQEALDREF